MSSTTINSILRTLVYADIFNYPLTIFEIWKWLICDRTKNIDFEDVQRALRHIKNNKNPMLSKVIDEYKGYYFLKGKKYIVALRHKRTKWSEEKIKKAQKYAFILRFLPFIQLVGISGGLAMGNAKENDDIDLFIITESDDLWLARFIIVLVFNLLGKRRRPNSRDVNNLICLNMFIDENHLALSASERDLFSAHEVVQMFPIWSKNHSYEKFLLANRWVQKYIVHATANIDIRLNIRNFDIFGKRKQFIFLNLLLGKIQKWYMKNRKTTEMVSNYIVRFHPRDARIWILDKYKKKLKRYNLKD